MKALKLHILFTLCVMLVSFHTLKGLPKAEKDTSLTKITIRDIHFFGLENTKPHIIRRELIFAEGEQYFLEELLEKIEASEHALHNTTLFLEVRGNIANWKQDELDVEFHFRERWHLWGRPIFHLADRNFNVWWTDFNRSFDRTVYGLFLTHYNMRGRREVLSFHGHLGYNRRASVSYFVPGIGSQQNFGTGINFSWQSNKEVFYHTIDHKQQFQQLPGYSTHFWDAEAYGTYRLGLHQQFGFGAGYHDYAVLDTVITLNEQYFGDNTDRLSFASLEAFYRRDTRDKRIYATSGTMLDVRFRQSGLGVFSEPVKSELFGVYSYFAPLGKQFYLSAQLRGKLSLPRSQPYVNQQSLGFLKDLVRGYEYYVIDGRHHGVFKLNTKRRLFSLMLNQWESDRLSKLKNLPMDIYLKAFFDAGYVYDDYFYTGDFLINRFLYSAGAGIDVVTAYDFVWRIEYTVNHMKEHGLFLHFLTDL